MLQPMMFDSVHAEGGGGAEEDQGLPVLGVSQFCEVSKIGAQNLQTGVFREWNDFGVDVRVVFKDETSRRIAVQHQLER